MNSSTDDDGVWYLAYGSNMSSAKFTGSRGIVPQTSARVRVPGYALAFNIPGLPYSEPAFTSIQPRNPNVGSEPYCSSKLTTNFRLETVDVLGIAYRITREQYIQIIASEGGGTAYDDAQVQVVPIGEDDRAKTGDEVMVRTLVGAMERNPWPRPSKRYMEIIITGALEAGMPDEYQHHLETIEVYRPSPELEGKIGAAVFLAIFGPVMQLMNAITNLTIRSDGYAPKMVIWLVRSMMSLIWIAHDAIFAPLCGRGDGRKEYSATVSYEIDVSEKRQGMIRI